MPDVSHRTANADLSSAIDGVLPLAEALFEEARVRTADTLGVSREPYGAGEKPRWTRLTRAARDLGSRDRCRSLRQRLFHPLR